MKPLGLGDTPDPATVLNGMLQTMAGQFGGGIANEPQGPIATPLEQSGEVVAIAVTAAAVATIVVPFVPAAKNVPSWGWWTAGGLSALLTGYLAYQQYLQAQIVMANNNRLIAAWLCAIAHLPVNESLSKAVGYTVYGSLGVNAGFYENCGFTPAEAQILVNIYSSQTPNSPTSPQNATIFGLWESLVKAIL
jgi:hypothetical protein